MDDRKHRLVRHGMVLFLIGLLIGFAGGQVSNPRMALAAHLEGLMNVGWYALFAFPGTFLIALGAVWSVIHLPSGLVTVAYWALLYGAYA